AAALAVACKSVLSMTHVVTMHTPPADPAGGDAEHGQAASPAGEQAAEQVVVAGVIAEGEARVAGQLIDRMLMSRLIDDGRHRDRDPLLAGARLAAGRPPRPRA